MNKILAHNHSMGKVQNDIIELPYGNAIGLYTSWICMDKNCEYHEVRFFKNKNLTRLEKIKIIVQKYTLNDPDGEAGYLKSMRVIESLCDNAFH